jgi:ribosomal-protein-alanine N-acetyltransferase
MVVEEDALKPLIETARLLLRPMIWSDVDALLHIFSDPKVMASFGEPPFDRARMERWVQRNLDHQTQYGYGLFSVTLKSDGLLIGDCGPELHEVDGELEAELGYDFRSDYWGQGFATEAASAVRDYAFNILELPRLISLIRVGNEASRRVAEKVGMKCVAELNRYDRRYWKYSMERVTHDRTFP